MCQPCAFIHVRSIGRVDAEWNPKTVAKVSEAVTESLKLPLNRVFVRVEEVAARDWGTNGKTIA